MPIRPPSSARIAIGKPCPASPSSASPGSQASSNTNWQVVEPRSPVLSSCRATWTPLASRVSRNAETPLAPGSPVRAQTTIRPARSPLVIHCFVPRSTQPSPRRSAIVRSDDASEPDEGSERANAPHRYSPPTSLGTCVRRCASLPNSTTISATMLVTATATDVDAQPRASSIIESA